MNSAVIVILSGKEIGMKLKLDVCIVDRRWESARLGVGEVVGEIIIEISSVVLIRSVAGLCGRRHGCAYRNTADAEDVFPSRFNMISGPDSICKHGQLFNPFS